MSITRLETLLAAAAQAAQTIDDRRPAMGDPLFEASLALHQALRLYGLSGADADKLQADIEKQLESDRL